MMPSRGDLAMIAMRYDTLPSDAMLRALGIERRARGRYAAGRVPDMRYEGMLECFENRVRLGYRAAMSDG
ncbi:hypothetical protein EII22_08925 [Coriobacteriales bacterium OH1046]|nr:hypothetical protein EII22_08925 [Coriobacteriales bacterium OH1046]